ncbi:hypothetical protein [Cryptosporangium sp. NPDC051539]|uniref:hypothetical protein n=1 Tax=Cryptosporangium sp. NPDC051539 TaxID=3363962 RepID=UPI0037A3497E
MGLPKAGSHIPRTPVLGYVRAGDPDVVELLWTALDDYGRRAGLVVVDVLVESPDVRDMAAPAFARCIESVRDRGVRGVLFPTWAHLAPDEDLGSELLTVARDANALLYVADQSSIPSWAFGAASQAHQVAADQRAAQSERFRLNGVR